VRLASLRAKLLWGTCCVLALAMTGVFVVVEHRQRAIIVDEFQRRGEVLARNLAAISYGPLLLYNYTALEQNVARVGEEADVLYAVVLDADGKVAAHSRHPEHVGLALQGAGAERATATAEPTLPDTVAARGRSVYDFTVPVQVEGRTWGTIRVGLSTRRMDAEIRKTRIELGALAVVTLLLGGGAAALMARRIARPMQQLTESAIAISRGDLAQRIDVTTSDEIGRLAAAFNHMAVELAQRRRALEDAHGELQRQFVELADLKSYTDNILGSLTNGIVTVDLDGRVVTLNPAAELLTGFFRGEVAGRYCSEAFAHTPELSDILMETLVSRAQISGVTLTLRRRNGSTVPIEFGTAPLKGGDGKDLGVIGVFRDLTLVRRLESDLRRSDRLVALGTLAAGLAHEIKNPLTSLVTFSRHLERRFDDTAFRERFQNVVPRELERINAIVERLLELARPTRMTLSLVRLPAILETVVELYANQLEAHRIDVVREYARDLPPIQVDQEGIYRVLVNLVANAIEAMPAGGRLTLRAGWSEDDDALPRRRAGRRGVRIEVADTGPGIPASESDRIFNPFYTTKPGGTGIGLALAHKIVEDHGGTIRVRSGHGDGTVFTVVLSLLPEPPVSGLLGDEARR
jgi:PAS domain S-box-containing protein